MGDVRLPGAHRHAAPSLDVEDLGLALANAGDRPAAASCVSSLAFVTVAMLAAAITRFVGLHVHIMRRRGVDLGTKGAYRSGELSRSIESIAHDRVISLYLQEDQMNLSKRPRSLLGRGVVAGLAITAVAVSLAAGGAAGTQADAAAGNGPSNHAVGDNWNFEKGDFTGWKTSAKGSGAWHVYADGSKPPNPANSDPNVPFSVPQPPEGQFAATTDMSAPGTRILYRDVTLGGPVKLRLTVFYVNVGKLASPASLRYEMRKPNQQFRVDLMDPAAPVGSTAAAHVLATIFHTTPGDPDNLAPKTIAVDLSRWADKKVRIRLAQVDNQGPLRAGVDNVSLQPIGS